MKMGWLQHVSRTGQPSFQRHEPGVGGAPRAQPRIAQGWMKYAACLALPGVVVLAGCALESNPEPPTLWMPVPVKNLTATRAGNEIQLRWTMPKETTDKLALKGDQKAHFCWESEKGAMAAEPVFRAGLCVTAGDAAFAPGRPADFVVKMPAELVTGPPRAVSYFVELENPAGKTAGPSNGAWAGAGAAPEAVAGLQLEAQAAGVVLRWDPAAPEPGLVLRIQRTLVNGGAGKKSSAEHGSEANGEAPPEEQTLEVPLDKEDLGVALDHDATLDHIWSYQVERVLKGNVDGHALEIGGRPSGKVTIDAKDVFPPATPSGLVAVADEQAHAIDLSWEPDTEADVAGYVVYRRDVSAGTGVERISGKAPVAAPSFSDAKVQAGHEYVYSVSAVDEDGNESARSKEVEEELAQ